jgi:anti-anti-sigma factor
MDPGQGQPWRRLTLHGALSVIQGKKHVNAENGPQKPIQLSHRVLPNGETAVEIVGELDIGTADKAFRYVQKIINRRRGPVVVSLAEVRFCDARGLRTLVRMADYAELSDCQFRVTAPSPRLARLMQITGLDHKLLAAG